MSGVPSAVASDAGGRTLVAPRGLRLVALSMFVASVPLFLITTTVRQIALDSGVYERGFARYEVGRRTGLSTAQLRDVAAAFIGYFDGSRPSLQVQVDLPTGQRDLFNEREIDHMRDVRHLIDWVGRLQLVTGSVLVLVPVVGFAVLGSAFQRTLGMLGVAGGGLTIGLLALLGGLSLLDFSEVFVRFHLLMFDNDLWILDPTRDYLIMLFPEGFWFDATMRIAATTAIQALALAGVGAVLRLRRFRR